MKKIIPILLPLILLLTHGEIFSQTISNAGEANNWYFGFKTGITFNGCCPTPLLDGQMQTDEGCASISDRNGNLLFYTNGEIVFNRQHQVMDNGENLFGNWSSYQSAIIVPLPGDTNIYYIFTSDCSEEAGKLGYNYSIVDLRHDGGLGSVITKNVNLYSPSSEQLIAVKHKNKKDIWIITHERSTNCFYTFLLTSQGLKTTPIINCIGLYYDIVENVSYQSFKSNIQGNRLVYAQKNKIKDTTNLFMYNFDNINGNISLALTLYLGRAELGPSQLLEFSPDGKYLYYYTVDWDSTFWMIENLRQFDLTYFNKDSILNSQEIIHTRKYKDFGFETGAMQIGPDCKIYISKSRNQYLGVIHNPNEKGIKCNYDSLGVDLLEPLKARHGLPNFINDYFTKCNCSTNPINYPDFSDTKDLSIVGDASAKNNLISLTKPGTYLAGAFWNNNQIDIDRDFNMTFKFRLKNCLDLGLNDSSSCGGDGLAFVFQNNSTKELGYFGGGIGYSGIPNSIAIEIDLYNNNYRQIEDYNDPNGNHIAVQSKGTEKNSSYHNPSTTLGISDNIIPIISNGSIYQVKIQYKKSFHQLCVFIDTSGAFKTPAVQIDSFDFAKIINLSNKKFAWLGFTAGTGSSFQEQDILSWEMCYPGENLITGVEEPHEKEKIAERDLPNIYPNPVFDWLIINLDGSPQAFNQNIEIISVEGINILSVSLKSSISNGHAKIDVSGITNGFYFVKIGNKIQKFIKL